MSGFTVNLSESKSKGSFLILIILNKNTGEEIYHLRGRDIHFSTDTGLKSGGNAALDIEDWEHKAEVGYFLNDCTEQYWWCS